MKSHVLGLPRIGARREWKFALEAFWKGDLTEQGLEAAARMIRADNRARQRAAGLDFLTVGDFAAYDQVLTAFLRYSGALSWADQFRLARGEGQTKPWDMTKWFDTNYHYLVPEFDGSTSWVGEGEDLLAEVDEALAEGASPENIKAVLLGPVTLLALSKGTGSRSPWESLAEVAAAYHRILVRLKSRGLEWVQVDEPILVLDTDSRVDQAMTAVYGTSHPEHPKILLATYFGPVDHRGALIDGLAVDGVHLDLVRGPGQLAGWALPAGRVLSLGLIDGRNVWTTRPGVLLGRLAGYDGRSEAWVASSCSLQHVPVDLTLETDLDPALAGRLSFAVQKLTEVKTLSQNLPKPGEATAPAGPSPAPPLRRQPSFEARANLQALALNLPPWPTTTIGSFPQTAELRALRAQWKKGVLSTEEYERALRDATAHCVHWQEELGLDVL